ncbi:hypothetical protein BHE74_00035526 [Ensete ventricosum]|uniref:Uncharacterized protein n=1 Tax=Ensete ventricosum TaxID=4639 RepID=A0A444FRH2_ENSVE|nr:hypothetical protein B296_00052308 [Ensete ventricosum]RWW25179.1 hypothetical protein GW17_00010495 [Ensete ventricosum]RWW57666.1 hypothetical protein BHE74_00035526 [Ensete ventricosum]
MAIMLRKVYNVICEKQEAMVQTSHLTKSLIIGGVPYFLVYMSAFCYVLYFASFDL